MAKKSIENMNATENVVFTAREKEVLAKKYMPLIYKIANQFAPLGNADDIFGWGQEGFADALNTYNVEKSNGQTFQQYAGFRIRYFIQKGLASEGSTIKLTDYKRKQMAEGKIERVSTTSLDLTFDGEDMYTDHCIAVAVEDRDEEKEEIGAFSALRKTLEKEFGMRDCEVLYSKYGLYGRPEIACKEISEKFGISGPRISAILKKMYAFISKQEELADELRDLLYNC